ncbi:MAG: TIGR04282 family arsenosugar biosynthesis glycosyltransferase [Pirellulales bacterium]|nr:TIGR04282 family arsenosugar biosynthesis glycosyltransferase [Pirellulales bacterium]
MANECLGLFAKNWVPGKVKTRLAHSLGKAKSAEVYRAFVVATIARLSSATRSQVVAYAPDDDAAREVFLAPAFDGWSLEPQSEGDLGDRMAAFFQNQISKGDNSIVLLGTDSPNIPLARIDQAFAALESHEVVLVPTEDGGYCLVGIARRVPPIFEGIPWSTPQVWESTIARLQESNTSFQALKPWYDVDEIDHLQRLLDDLHHAPEDDAVLKELLRQLKKLLSE